MPEFVTDCVAAIKRLTTRSLRPVLRNSVFVKSILYRFLWMLPERFRGTDSVREALKTLGTAERPVFFVNIGANDGLAGDPLREFVITRRWRGILVEPVPFVFERLKKAYRGRPAIFCENAAIAETSGVKQFWYLRKNRVLDPGYDQVGSLDRSRVEKLDQSIYPGSDRFLECCNVPCMTLRDLLAKHLVSHVDVFLVDTEGHDAKIVDQIDLATSPPSVIIYEHRHLSSSEQERCLHRLKTAKYELRECGGNTIAALPTGTQTRAASTAC